MVWKNSWQLYALGSAFFAGLTAILGKLGVQGVPSNVATLIRTVVILLFIAALVGLRGELKGLRLPEGSVAFLALSGLATGASWLCYYHALKLGPASRVAPVDKLSVIFAIVLAVVFLGEKLSLKAALGALLVGAGAVLLALP